MIFYANICGKKRLCNIQMQNEFTIGRKQRGTNCALKSPFLCALIDVVDILIEEPLKKCLPMRTNKIVV